MKEPQTFLHHGELAVFRGYLQGLELSQLAKRYLSGMTANDAAEVVRDVWLWLAVAAHRSGQKKYERLFSEISQTRIARVRKHLERQVQGSETQPTLEVFVRENGLEDFSEDEQLLYYAEAYPAKSANSLTAPRHNLQRLVDQILAATSDLSHLVVKTPYAADAIGLWTLGDFAYQCNQAQLNSLIDVVRFAIEHGNRWYERLHGVGIVRAQRFLALWQAHPEILGPIPTRVRMKKTALRELADSGLLIIHPKTGIAPLERFDPLNIDGKHGWNRAPKDQSDLAADCDRDAIYSALKLMGVNSPHTQRAYRGECERLWLWSVLIARKSLPELTVENLQNYLDFLQRPEPIEDWCSGTLVSRDSPNWKPLRAPLTLKAAIQTKRRLSAIFEWWVSRGYLIRNPFAGIKLNAPKRLSHARVLTSQDEIHLLRNAQMSNVSLDPFEKRGLLAVEILLRTGLRSDELCRLQKQDLENTDAGWQLRVIGKGNKERLIPIESDLLNRIKDWHDHHNLVGWDELANTAAIICSARLSKQDEALGTAGRSAVNTSQLYKITEQVYRRLAIPRPKSAVHALRHTAITRWVSDSPNSLVAIQTLAGHGDLNTTVGYVHDRTDQKRNVVTLPGFLIASEQ